MTKKRTGDEKEKRRGYIIYQDEAVYIYKQIIKRKLGKGRRRIYFWNRSQETWPSTTSSGDAASLLL